MTTTQNEYDKNARTPRAIVTINGSRIKWDDLTVDSTTFYLADTFHVEFPLNGQDNIFSLDYWASTETFLVKIYIGFPADPDSYTTDDLELMIQGNADDIQVDLGSARVGISGRDLASSFIDNKTTEKFSNQTSSQIVEMFAKQYSLKTRVKPTSTLVGSYYSQQQVMLSSEITQWDLMVFLAQQEDYVLFVEGDTLVFEPRPTDQDVKNPYVINYSPVTSENGTPSINAVHCSFSRSMTLASDAKVTVRVPYGSKTGKAFSVFAVTKHKRPQEIKGTPNPTGRVQKYSFSKPGLTQEQALKFAQQRLREITLHEIKLNAVVPGINSLKKDSLIQLKGTNTTLDQYYYSDQVSRTINMSESGYTMTISAKNHSVDNQVSPD